MQKNQWMYEKRFEQKKFEVTNDKKMIIVRQKAQWVQIVHNVSFLAWPKD